MSTIKGNNRYLRQGPLSSIHSLSYPAQTTANLALSFLEANGLSNKILASLPAEDLARLAFHLEMVTFERREELQDCENGSSFIHFPLNAIVSQLSVLMNGSTTEVALIGNEGIVGLNLIFNLFMPERLNCVAVAGRALRMRAEIFKSEFERGGAFQHALLTYAGNYFEQVSQRAVCNSQHKIEERLAAWLLMVHDRAGTDLLPLTQEEIACYLGTRRSSITLAALALQQHETIGYLRGRIHILNRAALEMSACECYRTPRRG